MIGDFANGLKLSRLSECGEICGDPPCQGTRWERESASPFASLRSSESPAVNKFTFNHGVSCGRVVPNCCECSTIDSKGKLDYQRPQGKGREIIITYKSFKSYRMPR